MIRYFRKRRKIRQSGETVIITFNNNRTKKILVRSEDVGFDYLHSCEVAAGSSHSESIRKGAHICVWEQNEIVGEYDVKIDRDDDIIIDID